MNETKEQKFINPAEHRDTFLAEQISKLIDQQILILRKLSVMDYDLKTMKVRLMTLNKEFTN